MEEYYLEIINMSSESMVDIPLKKKQILAKAITDVNTKFVEWIGKREMFFETRYPDDEECHNKWMYELNEEPFDDKVVYMTTEELFNYFITNIYNK